MRGVGRGAHTLCSLGYWPVCSPWMHVLTVGEGGARGGGGGGAGLCKMDWMS